MTNKKKTKKPCPVCGCAPTCHPDCENMKKAIKEQDKNDKLRKSKMDYEWTTGD